MINLLFTLLTACTVDYYATPMAPTVHETEILEDTGDSPVVTTDSDIPDPVDSDPQITTEDTDTIAVGDDTDVVHPTMDEFGNPLYPILDPTVNEGFYVCSWFGDDADGDGYTLAEGDCHDGAAWIHPGAVEIPNNGTDNNCDGMEECYGDHDGDGYPFLSAPTTLVNGIMCPQLRPDDCDDNNPNQNRGAVELPCNHIDENCDGQDM